MNPFENINLGNEAYLKTQNEKLEKCKQKAIDFTNEFEGLDFNHRSLFADWAVKTAFCIEFIKYMQNN